MHATSFKR
jgi:hypothetical protein